MTDRKPVFIEKIMPVKLLNEQVYYENGGNPFKGLHRWYSRKPLSFSRASVLGSLLPADISMEEFEYLLGLDMARANENETEKSDRHQRTRLYKTPPTPERVKRVQELCEQMWGNKTPAVLDAFAGGGSIPFEAARYGLRVFASDLNPVAVVTMKAAIEFPLQFGAALQEDIDKWVKWVGDEAEKRLSEFFPSQDGEKVQNYLWAHTVVCPSCQSTVPLSPNWWLYKRPEKQNLSKWCAVKLIPNLAEKRVDFELVNGKKSGDKGIRVGQASSLSNQKNQSPSSSSPLGKDSNSLDKGNVGQDARPTTIGIYNPDDFSTIARGVGKCPNCDSVIEDQVVKNQAQNGGLGHQLYAVAFKRGQGSLEFRVANQNDLEGICKAENYLKERSSLDIPEEERFDGFSDRCIAYGLTKASDYFNPRQLLTLVTYVEIINEAKEKIREELGEEKLQAIATYLAMVLSRCADRQCRLARWHPSRSTVEGCSAQHSLNLMWNYPETSGDGELWHSCADVFASDYEKLCDLLATEDKKKLFNLYSVGQASSLSTPNNQSVRDNDSSLNDDRKDRLEACPTRIGENGDDEIYLNPDLKVTYRNWGKLPHWELNGSIYFITFNTIERIELTPEARQTVLDACRFFDNQRYQLYSAVIMPDHVHLLLQPLSKDGEEYWTLASILHSIKSYTAKQIPKVMNHIGTVWQDSRHDRIIRDERELIDTWEYIRQNPVKADLSLTPEDYPFLYQIQNIEPNPYPLPLNLVGQASSLSNNLSNKNVIVDNTGDNDRLEACPTNISSININFTNYIQIDSASADNLAHISDSAIDAIVTDPPYYSTIQYAELSDFFYVWQKRILGDIFPELYYTELTDKDREAVANPSRFRDMGISPKELADRDYEAKMQSAFGEYYRVLKDNGVMTVQFNHKDSGAWDVLAQSLIVAGFEITASWAVSTENPQNLHQAQKNSVSSTVLLICRKRDPNAGQAWWDDLRPEVANLVEQRAPEFEANEIQGIDLYLSAFGPALNVFSRNYPILDSTGEEVRPEVAFAEARKAVANYRFRKLAQTDTAGFDPLTQWYFLAWDAFQAREFPFDDARQLAFAVGGFNVADLGKTYKLLDIKSGTCKLLTPDQRYKKHAFSLVDNEFSARYLIDGLHAIIAIYLEEQTIEPVRRFMKATGLLSNEMFMRSWEVALRVIPHISDPRKRIPEEKALADLWLAMDEIKAQVSYVQPEIDYASGQMGLDFDTTELQED